ncbi:MAG TPA: hypothetical protein VEB23_04765, partial [Ramlibacter sp.]|nr:hypothetical protein [Ramlibacter sp.]
MADLDVMFAGGATGALKRATQLANARAANARRMANSLRRSQQTLRNSYSSPEFAAQQAARRRPPPPRPKPRPRRRRPGEPESPQDLLGLGMFSPTAQREREAREPGRDTRPWIEQFTGNAGPDAHDTTDVHLIDRRRPDRLGPSLPGQSAVPVATGDYMQRDPGEIKRFGKMTPKQQQEVRQNYKDLQGDKGRYVKSVKHMLDLIKRDPLQDTQRFLAGQDLADAFRDQSKLRYFTDRELVENPLLATLNDLAVWSDYRLRLREFADSKKKSGEVELGEDDAGDGTFAGIVDNNSFSSVTSPSNLSKWLVARDENGLLQVVSAEQWIQSKWARMRHDPEYAAQMITALAVTSAYGSDSTANSQRSRLVMDKDGNPVKGFASEEDLNALKDLALQVAILQNQGDEVAIDDSIAELTKMAFDVTEGAEAAGDFGGGGYGYGGGGGWGYGGGGGGYGGEGAVRYTDATQLTSMVSSIARQR